MPVGHNTRPGTAPIPVSRGFGPTRPAAPPPVAPQPPPMPALPAMPAMPSIPQVQAPQVQVPQVQVPTAPPINGAPGGQGAPSPGIPGAGSFGAQNSPELMEFLDRVRTRLDKAPDDTRALNQAGIAVNQFAQGQRNNAMGDAARRGVLGVSGAEGQIQDDIGNVAQGNFARAAENIAIQRMRDNDAFLAGAQGAFAEPGRQNLADRGLGIQAAGQQGSLDIQRARMAMDAQLANAGMVQQANMANVQAQIQAQQQAAQQQMQLYAMMANLYR